MARSWTTPNDWGGADGAVDEELQADRTVARTAMAATTAGNRDDRDLGNRDASPQSQSSHGRVTTELVKPSLDPGVVAEPAGRSAPEAW